jgi:hypothetical protein
MIIFIRPDLPIIPALAHLGLCLDEDSCEENPLCAQANFMTQLLHYMEHGCGELSESQLASHATISILTEKSPKILLSQNVQILAPTDQQSSLEDLLSSLLSNLEDF